MQHGTANQTQDELSALANSVVENVPLRSQYTEKDTPLFTKICTMGNRSLTKRLCLRHRTVREAVDVQAVAVGVGGP